jgi:2-aminoadipate transaminase
MFAERIGGLKSSAIRDILKVIARPGMISFAGGLPAPELFPLDEVLDLTKSIFSKYGSAILQYSVTEGIAPLREKICRMLDPEGKSLGPDNILVTHGSQQALDLLSKLYIEKGTVVLTENPSYLGALQCFTLFQAYISPVDSDEDGIVPGRLDEAASRMAPALLYVMPNFQNPGGISTSATRRHAIVDMARRHGFMVIEDDPYGELIFEGERPSSLLSLGGTDSVIRLGSFSKTIAPGLRIAFVAAGEEIIQKLAIIKQGTDLQTNTFGQYLVNEYLQNGGYHNHISILRRTYGSRRDVMIGAMQRHFPAAVKWNRPSGGMFLWVKLPEGSNARDLLTTCLERQVAFVPGQEFFPDGSGENTIRLNYSNASPENIEEGIKRMGEAMREMGI